MALRALHLLCVVGLGGAILGAPLEARPLGLAVFASGSLLFGLDLYTNPNHLREISGLSVLLKLLLVALIVASEPLRQPLFWLVVLWSAVFSHAPGSLRHRRLFSPRPPDEGR